ISELISRLTIDRLHIVGDIFDRGPGAHIVMDALTRYHDVDLQWGNHDMLWMGAAAGCDALIATAVINSLKYGNIDTLEEGYGISLSPLIAFALSAYRDDPCLRFMPKLLDAEGGAPADPHVAAKVHKAMAVILFKLEAALIRRNPHFHMENRLLLDKVDYAAGTVRIGESVWPLADARFPTVLPSAPGALSETEADIVFKLRRAFLHSEKLQEHVRFLLAHGGMYLTCNDNLLFHGCVPTDEHGDFIPVELPDGSRAAGRAYLDRADALVRAAFAERPGSPARERAADFLWYLWCGPHSPLFGKDQMTTFERYFIADKAAHTEHKSTYFRLAEEGWFADRLLQEFGLDPARAHIINGHVPVKIRKGESPVKADGKLIVIDGGMSKAYQTETGIAGYTLIYSSNELALSCHDPFVTVEEAVKNEVDIHSTQTVVRQFERRMLVADTDRGAELKAQIRDLQRLLSAYRSGRIKERLV
ncbi:MAG: fructose-bisphosphatase class III, partial [Clostridia bacterium]|nr:fructose-bisphosphatase class III [Clostridia bacterium]